MMETNNNQISHTQKAPEVKKTSLLKRFRRSFTLVFRRRHTTKKRTKSLSQVPGINESLPTSEKDTKRRASLTLESTPKIDNLPNDSPKEPNFRPVAKVAVFSSDFTSELKQSLQLRSRKIDEGEKSPTEAIQEVERRRTLSNIVDVEKDDVKVETETKTFEEKLALFEGTGSISGSGHNTLNTGGASGSGGVESTTTEVRAKESDDGVEEFGNEIPNEDEEKLEANEKEIELVDDTEQKSDIKEHHGEEHLVTEENVKITLATEKNDEEFKVIHAPIITVENKSEESKTIDAKAENFEETEPISFGKEQQEIGKTMNEVNVETMLLKKDNDDVVKECQSKRTETIGSSSDNEEDDGEKEQKQLETEDEDKIVSCSGVSSNAVEPKKLLISDITDGSTSQSHISNSDLPDHPIEKEPECQL